MKLTEMQKKEIEFVINNSNVFVEHSSNVNKTY